MKKFLLLLILISSFLFLSSCKKGDIIYTDDEAFHIEMRNDSLKILQITDLHLTYGIDYGDQKTFSLIENLSKHDQYDLIVITGDLTMSPQGPALFKRLIKHMESLEIPWTFVFGNHETDYNDYQDFLNEINDTTYLYFKVGPRIDEGGVGNFKITFTKNDEPFYHAYFLDSKAEVNPNSYDSSTYGYINSHQVAWYQNHISQDNEKSLVFMHIPLIQYAATEGYIGVFNEKQVYHQSRDEGFYDAMVTGAKSKAIFVGHDHLNDFYVMKDDIMLAYGRITGYNGYGNLERGGRHIEITSLNELSSIIVLESDLS
jgi:3',5'-cyclic AMP phosphodiesterase CpdA